MSISVGSVAVDVVPDTRKFATELKAKLKDVSTTVRVDADTTALRAKLDEATHPRTVTINANADTSAAEAKIDAAARNRKSKIDVSAAGTGLTAILALGPALVPITAAVGGLAAAFALPLAAAGGGLTLGAIVAGAAIKQTETQKKKIDQLAKSVAAAKQNLANVQASSAGSSAISATAAQQSGQTAISNALVALQGASTPAAKLAAERRLTQARASLANSLANTQARSSLQVAGAQRKVTEATAAYDAAVKGLTPAQARFLKTQQALKDSFKGLVASAGPAIFGPVIKGMDLLSKIMPSLKGPLTAVSGAVGTLLGDLGKAASGPGFKNFMNAFGTLAASSIVSFGHIFGNFAKGTFGLMAAFAPLSKTFVSGLGDMSKRFADWGTNVGKSKGFQNFLAYVRDVGPKVAATIGSLVKAIVHIAVALAPIGALALGSLKVLSDVIRVIPTPVLTALASGIIAVVVALKAAQIINNGSRALGTLSTTINGFRGADSQLSKTAVGIRGLAGTAGLGALTVGASTSNKALGILSSAGGGALLGFSLGGPIGLAVGAGAGALLGLATQAGKTKDALQQSKQIISDYASTLDQMTGATTAATRALALQNANKAGILPTTRAAGISDRTVINAIVSGGKARDKVIAGINREVSATDDAIAAKKRELAANIAIANDMSVPLAQQTAAANRVKANRDELDSLETLRATRKKDADQVLSNLGAVQKGIDQTQKNAAAINDLTGKLKGIPRDKRLAIKAEGIIPTTKGIATLAEKYKLTPTQVQTIITASGVSTSIKEIQRLRREIDLLKGKTIPVRLRVTAQQLVGDPSLGKPRWTGVEGAGARGAIINRPTVALIGENGPERLTPLDQTAGNEPLPSGGGASGAMFHIDKVVAQDVNDFLTQMQKRARLSASDGRRR